MRLSKLFYFIQAWGHWARPCTCHCCTPTMRSCHGHPAPGAVESLSPWVPTFIQSRYSLLRLTARSWPGQTRAHSLASRACVCPLIRQQYPYMSQHGSQRTGLMLSAFSPHDCNVRARVGTGCTPHNPHSPSGSRPPGSPLGPTLAHPSSGSRPPGSPRGRPSRAHGHGLPLIMRPPSRTRCHRVASARRSRMCGVADALRLLRETSARGLPHGLPCALEPVLRHHVQASDVQLGLGRLRRLPPPPSLHGAGRGGRCRALA